jgi:hypothetical protein
VAGPAAISPIKQGISTSDVVLGVSGVFPSTVGGGGNPDDEEQNDDGQMKDLDDDLMDEDEAKNEADDGPGFWDTGGAANDAELAANVDQVWSTMASITGNILTKAEIIISYFQLYALYLVIDLHIPWPQIWLAFSRFVYFFSFNINIAFDFTIPYREQIEFGILASVPLMFYLFYVTVDRMKSDKWIERYSNEWISTRRKAFVTWVVFIILVLFGALFYDYPVSYNLVLSGHFPQPNTSGLVLVCWGIVTFFALIWYMVVSNFRKNYVGVDHHEFVRIFLPFIALKSVFIYLKRDFFCFFFVADQMVVGAHFHSAKGHAFHVDHLLHARVADCARAVHLSQWSLGSVSRSALFPSSSVCDSNPGVHLWSAVYSRHSHLFLPPDFARHECGCQGGL